MTPSLGRFGHPLALILLLLLVSLGLSAQAWGASRRFALILGSNQGGETRPPLRYANLDARHVAALLEELGGVRRNDALVLQDADPDAFHQGWQQMKTRLQEARQEGLSLELVFYYSGHSDEAGLLMQGGRVAYPELRHRLDQLPADVRVVIVDSCASGALTRSKGGQRRLPFLEDDATQVKGLAILTSSSASEVSQESDRLQGSFFTQALIAGLRGAADSDGNGRVTLAEAYQHAFQETLARTENTHHGAQHPAYDFQLVGTGDLVLSDIRTTNAGVALAKEAEGRISLRDEEGRLVLELRKRPGRAMTLALGEGTYELLWEQAQERRAGTLTLRPGLPQPIRFDALTRVAGEWHATRGGEEGEAPDDRRADEAVPFIPFTVSLAPIPGTPSAEAWHAATGVSLSLLWGRVGENRGLMISAGANESLGDSRGVQLGLVNLSSAMAGLQMALLNFADDATGAQLGLVNRGKKTDGFQGGLINLADDVQGAQLGLIDIADGMTGAQLGLVNRGKKTDGFQGGLINLADDVRGAQLGLVNLSRGKARGVQLGLINLGQSLDGFSLALLPLYAEGIHAFQTTLSDSGALSLGLKLGNRTSYSLIEADFQFRSVSERLWEGGRLEHLTLGFGLRFPLGGGFSLEGDLAEQMVTFDQPDTFKLRERLRLSVGYAVLDWLEIQAGLALNLSLRKDDSLDRKGIFPAWTLRASHPEVLLWPGFFVGLQLGEFT